MKKYNKDEPCPKCGSMEKDLKCRDTISEYKKGGMITYKPRNPEDIRMEVKCGRCGYTEEMLPLDAKE